MFCPECGTRVADEALTCGQCGKLLPVGPNRSGDSSRFTFAGTSGNGGGGGGQSGGSTQTALPGNVAALLCYVLGWVTGVIFLVVGREDRFIRFHAWQSILTFGGVTVIYILLNILYGVLSFGLWRLFFLFSALHAVVGLGSFILWLILLVKAYQGQRYKLPLVGGAAERYAGG